MSDFSIWGIGVAAGTAATLAAVVVFAWYSYLKSRLPLAVRYRDLENRVLDFEGQCLQLAEELERNRQELKEVLQRRLEAELETADARAWLEKNQEKLENIPAMKAEIATIEEQLRSGRETLQKLNDELLQAQALRLEEEEKAANARREVTADRAELAELKTYKERLVGHVAALQQQQRQLESQIAKNESDCHKLADQLERLQQSVQREEQRLAALQEEAKKAKADQRVAERACEEAVARKDSVLREIGLKERDLGRLQREHETLAKKVESFQQAVEPPSLDKRLEDFTRPVLFLDDGRKPRRVSGQAGENRSLEVCTKYFKDCRFRFHPRTLNAFHTSLKIADISPLVVLAGISGTGKSQLPRLYAEAMGIHFLSVAVQPRWDSPQDLFGFYNYMEHRYKATELARAIRQMDKNWLPETDGEVSKRVQEGVLLVLLDEMNLARVEYYFSELLSKLEMRNAANVDEEDLRRLAGIEIDTGSRGKGDKGKPLLVGQNVLFCGTMNEDETTQSLSDKVVDRANMLRFGKPGQLSNEKPPRTVPPADYLRFADWETWRQTPLSADEDERLKSICGELNMALAKIHRPFGHRVNQAIYRYVASYPRSGNMWFQNALSDQLEQKIIPKLRGLSRDADDKADEVLDEIGGVIHKVNDDCLETAYHAARERLVFQWGGVNREADVEQGTNR